MPGQPLPPDIHLPPDLTVAAFPMHAVLGSRAQLDPHTGPSLTSEPQFPHLGSGVGICLLCGVVGYFIQQHIFVTSLPAPVAVWLGAGDVGRAGGLAS